MRFDIPIAVALVLAATPVFAQTRDPAPRRPDGAATATVSSERGRLGLQATEMTEELRVHFGAPRDAGVLVSKVIGDSSAAKAGLQVGDVIVKVDTTPVTDARGVREAVASKKRATIVVLSVLRAKRAIKLNARLDSDPVEELEVGADWHFGPGEVLDPWRMERRFHWNWQWPRTNVEDRLKELERRLDEVQKRLFRGAEPNKT